MSDISLKGTGIRISTVHDVAMYGTTRETALHFDAGRFFVLERTMGPHGASMVRQIDVTEEVKKALR